MTGELVGVHNSSRLTAAFSFHVINIISMKILSNIHCYTKTGPVVWTFYKLNGLYVATNGEDTIVKKSYSELKSIKSKFLTYKTKTGAQRFYPGLPKSKTAIQLELAVA